MEAWQQSADLGAEADKAAAEKIAIAGCGAGLGFHLPDPDSAVHAIVEWDDGSGPALYLGGHFTTAGGTVVNRVARWDGTEWTALGTGFDDRVRALAVFDDGSGEQLYAGGQFVAAGAVTVNHIARWNGTEWSALSGASGVGVDGDVIALQVHDDGAGEALFAGGYFAAAGGTTVNHIAAWDGSGWRTLAGPSGTGTNLMVRALTVYDDGSGQALFAGGNFTTAGGTTVNRVAKWDGTQWSALAGSSGFGTSSEVLALAVCDYGSGAALYLGGVFITAGGLNARNVAKWDGNEWSVLHGPLDVGTVGSVHVLAAYDDGTGEALIAGGDFHTAGGVSAGRIARWDGSEWSPLTGPSGSDLGRSFHFVDALIVANSAAGGDLIVGGWFDLAGGVVANNIARWNGTSWSAVREQQGAGMSDRVWTLLQHDDGGGPALFAGGRFRNAGDVLTNFVGKWDGAQWHGLYGPTQTGATSYVYTLAEFDDGGGEALYLGGGFVSAGGVGVNNIAKWDGSQWSALSGPSGVGTSGLVLAEAVYDDGSGEALYAGGSFVTAGGVTVNNIAKWDGSQWSALAGPSGVGTDASVHAAVSFDDGSGEALYVGGYFVTAGGVTVNRIARWDGSQWSALAGPSGVGLSNTVRALAVYDDGSGAALYVAGDSFAGLLGGGDLTAVARWDGSDWSAVAEPSGTTIATRVYALAVFDDGSGPALFAGGDFRNVGLTRAWNIAKWDGTEWSPLHGLLGTGVDDRVDALAVFDDGTGEALYLGGEFTTAWGVPSQRIAKWTCGAADCGDAPDTYPTTVANNGAWHAIVPGTHLGSTVDAELDGQPSVGADGDDNAATDDEDGVILNGMLAPGVTVGVEVVASGNGVLDGWIDFDGDQDWDDADDRIFAGVAVGPGTNTLSFAVPTGAVPQASTYGRFRMSSTGVAVPTGGAADGEVEDLEVAIQSLVLAGTKTVGGSFNPGGQVAYTIILTNDSTSDQPDNVGPELIDVLPGQLILSTARVVSGGGLVTQDVGTNTVTWDGSVPSGASVVLEIVATIRLDAAGQTVSNQSRILFDSDLDGSNDSEIGSDDPETAAFEDPTAFLVNAVPIPVLQAPGLMALLLLLAAAGAALLRRWQ